MDSFNKQKQRKKIQTVKTRNLELRDDLKVLQKAKEKKKSCVC